MPIFDMLGTLGAGWMAYEGQKDANEMNLEISQRNNMFNAEQAGLQRSWSAEQAAKANEFTRSMARTQWQRGVADMKKAGLNPMLAYSQGGNASGTGVVGSGSAASAAHVPEMRNQMGPAVSSALETARTISDIMTQEQKRNIQDPFEKLANVASKWIDEFGGFVQRIGEENRVVVGRILDAVEKIDVRELPAAVAGQVAEALEKGLRDVQDKVRRGVSSSAEGLRGGVDRIGDVLRDTESRVRQAIGEGIHGKRGIEVPPSRGKVPRDVQRRLREHEWKFNYRP